MRRGKPAFKGVGDARMFLAWLVRSVAYAINMREQEEKGRENRRGNTADISAC